MKNYFFFVVLDLMVNLNVIPMVHSIILALWFTNIGYFSYCYSFLNRQDLLQQMLVLIEMIIVLKMDYLHHMEHQQQQQILI